jgi:hypothetical protein
LIEYRGEKYGNTNYLPVCKSLDQYLSRLNIEEILKLKQTLPEEYDFKKTIQH